MLTYAKLTKTPIKFQRFTGLTVEEFDQLAADLEPMWKAAERKRKGESNAAARRGWRRTL